MAELVRKTAERKGDQTAIIDEAGEMSWSHFNSRVNRVIHLLRSLGVQPGDTIAVMSGNRRGLFEVGAAAIHSSLIFVPVNWHWVSRELAYVLGDSDAKVLFVEDQFADTAFAACRDPQAEGCPHRIIIGAKEVPGFANYEQLIGEQESSEPEGQATGGPMFYTSGTTGFPKGVRGAISLYPLLGLGSTCVMRQHFDAASMLSLVDRHHVTNVHLVPTQFGRLLKLSDEQKRSFDGSSLVSVIHGAAPCPVQVKQAMIEWWGPVLSEYYGGTESGFLTVIHGPQWLERPGSVGKSLGSCEVTIVDDEGESCEPGHVGQIYWRNLSGSDFSYHKAQGKTDAAHLTPGIATLGDVGHLDDEGFLFLSDRKIDMIVSGGVNIYPAEIEGVLVTHPAVADAAVFGVPDEDKGEQVKAAVELVKGFTASSQLADELIAYVRGSLAGYKAPKSIDFEGHLPRSETGKLFKRYLRDPYWDDVGRAI